MNMKKCKISVLIALYCIIAGNGTNALAVEVSQAPVFIGSEAYPGNLVLVPSVEWPTINSVANLEPNYAEDTTYVGYFDSEKCYVYRFSNTGSERHFAPNSVTDDHRCGGEDEWSGNFLNWAATQTIDPFRKALTGGDRVKDEPGVTWLEKARHDGQGGTGIYPNRSLTDDDVIAGATPFDFADSIHMRIQGLGSRMRFRLNNSNPDEDVQHYDPDTEIDLDQPDDNSYELEVRVAVCVSGMLEDNCIAYDGGWKPEGLIQRNDRKLRYSIFGYLNDSDMLRDGAAMRARQKYVGPIAPGIGPNDVREWDPETGVLVQNPDSGDAADTSEDFNIDVENSGVINYLNNFGQMTSRNHKSIDPVSELFYTAIRYMRGETSISEYTSMDGNNQTQRYQLADGFPVITDWDKDNHDPLLSVCQTNVALGIGDIYTHRDKNLPGSPYGQDEPSTPGEVDDDDWINVRNVTNRVGAMEGIGNIGSTSSFTGRNNSAYIAGLAYWANTTDMRPDDDGKVTMSTHWVDVLEAQSLEGMHRNQFALAAKYGGAKIPDDEDFDPMSDGLQLDWWHTNGETLTPFGRGNGHADFLRPDNYYLAGNAAQMVDSLALAFENILIEVGDVVSDVSTTSNRLDTGTLILQAGFDTSFWTGDIVALDPEEGTVEWRASDELPTADSRNIWTVSGNGADSTPAEFNTSLSDDMKELLGSGFLPYDVDILIDFIRGDRSDEDGETIRFRGDHVLGDIVNSDVVLSGPGNEGWTRLGDSVGESYAEYIDGAKQDREQWVFVGANDGMLHAFDGGDGDEPAAGDGQEAFAFIPNAVLGNLYELADPEYDHRFYVDGGIAVADVYDGGWKTVLVGSLGAGGRSVFALDVSDPSSFGNDDVMWEFTHEDMGYSFGTPKITRLQSGDWVAVFGNGYGSDTGVARLFVIDLSTGEQLEGIDESLLIVDDGPDNGLSEPSIWLDTQSRLFADRIYAGDLEGAMWRFDIADGGQPSSYYGLNPFFTTEDARPITSAPSLAASPTGGLLVAFGTGQLLGAPDRVSTNIESFYSIIDANNRLDGGADIGELTLTEEDGGLRSISGSADSDGWRIDFDVAEFEGERVLAKPTIIFGDILFSTFKPFGEVCSAQGGLQRLYVVDAAQGSGSISVPGAPPVGSIPIGEGAPIEVRPVIGQPPTPPAEGSEDVPGVPGDDDWELPDIPEIGETGTRDEWCRPLGYINPVTGEFVRFGTLCDGRQVWRQPL